MSNPKAPVPVAERKVGLFLFIACLTLGLAPFAPEPHLVGKLRWVAGGAVGMQLMDWLDLLLHGAPWLALIGWSFYRMTRSK